MSNPARKPGPDPEPEGSVTIISLVPVSRPISNDLPEDLGAGYAILLCGLSPGGVYLNQRQFPGLAVSSYLTLFTLTVAGTKPGQPAVSFLWHFPYFPKETVGVTHHPALWSPDFPPTIGRRSPERGWTWVRLSGYAVQARGRASSSGF